MLFFRPVKGICGFTKQVLVGVTTTIESREQKRIYNYENKLPPENPRASTTDDVECFFSTMRDSIGKNFKLKQVKHEMRKVYNEFNKRQDPSLPYYYFTAAHDRFHEGTLPDFDTGQEGKNNPRKMRLQRKEQPGCLVPGRATFAKSGARSTRMQYHNLPIDLPPAPGTSLIHIFEHSYSSSTAH